MMEFLEKELEIVLWSFWYQSSDWLHMKHSFLQVSNEFMWGNFVIVQIYVWWPVDCFNTSLQSRDLNLVVGWKFVSLQWQHYFKLFSSFFNSVYYIHANKHVNVCNIQGRVMNLIWAGNGISPERNGVSLSYMVEEILKGIVVTYLAIQSPVPSTLVCNYYGSQGPLLVHGDEALLPSSGFSNIWTWVLSFCFFYKLFIGVQ